MPESTEHIDPKESELMRQLQELCKMSALAIVKIAQNTDTNPRFVAKMYADVFQKVIKDLENPNGYA